MTNLECQIIFIIVRSYLGIFSVYTKLKQNNYQLTHNIDEYPKLFLLFFSGLTTFAQEVIQNNQSKIDDVMYH